MTKSGSGVLGCRFVTFVLGCLVRIDYSVVLSSVARLMATIAGAALLCRIEIRVLFSVCLFIRMGFSILAFSKCALGYSAFSWVGPVTFFLFNECYFFNQNR